MRLSKKLFFIFGCVLAISSCTAYKKLPYLQKVESLSDDQLAQAAANYNAKIMPKDILSITVNTPTVAASQNFNLPVVSTQVSEAIEGSFTPSNGGATQGYIVDNEGYINFPVLGKTSIGGLTQKEAEAKIYSLIYPHYLKEEPIVNIRFLNYKVAVLGEVSRPGIYSSPNGQMTLFDALAYAGDLTVYGKRDNVLLIRENEKGERKVFRINLQDKNTLLDNNVYYLQQNDKIIVEVNKAKGNNSGIGASEGILLSAVSVLISVIAIATR